jgi:hypothetical protein
MSDVSIDKALAILRARTPGRWSANRDWEAADDWYIVKNETENVAFTGDVDALAIVLAVNVAEAALAVAEAARRVLEYGHIRPFADKARDDLSAALAALDAAIEEET